MCNWKSEGHGGPRTMPERKQFQVWWDSQRFTSSIYANRQTFNISFIFWNSEQEQDVSDRPLKTPQMTLKLCIEIWTRNCWYVLLCRVVKFSKFIFWEFLEKADSIFRNNSLMIQRTDKNKRNPRNDYSKSYETIHIDFPIFTII